MSRRVLFNGTVLVRAGGATKVDVSAFQNLGLGGVGVVGLVGEADEGEPNVATIFTTPQAMVDEYATGALANAADLAFRPMNDPRVPGGANAVIAVKVNSGTQSSYSLLAGSDAMATLTSKKYGVDANKISVEIAGSGTGHTIELIQKKNGITTTETSPVLGDTAEFTIQYTGDGTTATMTINATTFATTLAGDQSDGSADLSVTLADYATLDELIDYINAQTGYTATLVAGNPFAFQSSWLDYVTAVDIKTAVTDVKAELYRIIEWVNANSGLVTAARPTGASEGTGAPDDVGPVFLAGGTRGTSDNTAWQAGFDLLAKVRANLVVPLISDDLSLEGNSSTATFASVAAMADAHAAAMSGTSGKSERQAWVGMDGAKADLVTQAQTFQSPHTVMVGQYITRADASSNLIQFPAWGLAVCGAGGRAGSLLGEPLVYKGIRCSGLTQDAGWNPTDDGADLILAGMALAFAPPEGGYKFDRVITTYSKLDNDAYVEESILMGWKTVAYELRTQLENVFTGVRAIPATAEGIADAAKSILEAFRKEGQITDSVLADGSTERAYRDITVTLDGDKAYLSAIISPVSGINFHLHTLFAVPATIAA